MIKFDELMNRHPIYPIMVGAVGAVYFYCAVWLVFALF